MNLTSDAAVKLWFWYKIRRGLQTYAQVEEIFQLCFPVKAERDAALHLVIKECKLDRN